MNAPEWIRTVRAAFWPYLSPIDRLRLDLDEQWSQGARLLRDAINRPANAIVWQSRRTAPHREHLRGAGLEPMVRDKTGLLLDFIPTRAARGSLCRATSAR